ncbi:hypothetical protein NM962_15760 [Mycobacterium sp. SVM_VP21]|nr:hypothetical protein NM962_15760 [Mycobacterium sp. SVM_VP21]
MSVIVGMASVVLRPIAAVLMRRPAARGFAALAIAAVLMRRPAARGFAALAIAAVLIAATRGAWLRRACDRR